MIVSQRSRAVALATCGVFLPTLASDVYAAWSGPQTRWRQAHLLAAPTQASIRAEVEPSGAQAMPWSLEWLPAGQYIQVSAQDEAFYGDALALEGDTLLVGAWGGSGEFGSVPNSGVGVVYRYDRQDSDWLEQEYLVGADAVTGSECGFAVALQGRTAAIGCPRQPGDGSQTDEQGAVYLFEQDSNGTFAQAQKIASASSQDASLFGFAIALRERLLVVGSPGDDAIDIYERASADQAWTHRARRNAPVQAGLFSRFGVAVATNGEEIWVGAREASVQGIEQAGAVYRYAKVGTNWQLVGELVSAQPQARGFFGQSVELDAGLALIGAPGEATSQGRVYPFRRQAGQWTAQARLDNTGSQGPSYGYALDLQGSSAIVGALNNAFDVADTGRADVFRFEDGRWQLQATLNGDGEDAQEAFGAAVAVDRQRVIVGAPAREDDGLFTGGIYYFERRLPVGAPALPAWAWALLGAGLGSMRRRQV